MQVDLIIHKQLNAREILVVGDSWKELYDFFQKDKKKYGIYFYTYKDNNIPFYAGKCTAKSFNILGRVWDELDDCDRGSGWLGKDISLLNEFSLFNEAESENGSFNPWKKLTGKNIKNRVKRFLDFVKVTFTYIDIDEKSRELDKMLSDIEVMLHEKLIERKILSKNWVDEHNLLDPDHHKEYRINPIYRIDGEFIKLDDSLFL